MRGMRARVQVLDIAEAVSEAELPGVEVESGGGADDADAGGDTDGCGGIG